MTLGEYRVGVDHNPSGLDSVARLKFAAANLIDMIGEIGGGQPVPPEVARLKALAQTAAEEAAMWAVKAATKPLQNNVR